MRALVTRNMTDNCVNVESQKFISFYVLRWTIRRRISHIFKYAVGCKFKYAGNSSHLQNLYPC